MTTSEATGLEAKIASWRGYLRRRTAVSDGDVEELEAHLRDQVAELEQVGLSGDEAFLVAVRRMGRLDHLSWEYAREHSDRLWKELVLGGDAANPQRRSSLLVALGFAVAAAAAVKIPELFGYSLDSHPQFFLRNASLFVLPFLAAYFAWRRRLPVIGIAVLAAGFVLAAAVANGYPFEQDGMTEALTAIHLPVALWLLVGVAYTAQRWRSGQARMDFIRFTGEWFIYTVLIGLGGGVLVGLTAGVFSVVNVDVDTFIGEWMLPCGAVGVVLVAAWLVEAKQSVIENMAPVLTKVFTPMFTLLLVAFLVVAAVQGTVLDIDRDLLIVFDLVLIVVLGLLLYSVSARDPLAPPTAFDRLQLVLIIAALAVDVLVLSAMVSRIGAFGFSANKVASLGLNLVLLANLAWSAVLLVRFLRRRRPYAALEGWQTGYLGVYLGWAVIVAAVFPPVFSFG